MENEKNLEYYMRLPYNIMVTKTSDSDGGYYYGKVIELDGCQSDGKTIEELYKNIYEAMEGYLSIKLEFSDQIPEPMLDGDLK